MIIFIYFQLNNPNISIPQDDAMKIIKTPSDTALFIEGTDKDDVVLQFKYPIEKFFFKFKWSLQKMSEQEFKKGLILPAFDALVRMQKSINRFNILQRQDPEKLERLPLYSPFDIKFLIVNLDSLDLMSEICKANVTVEALPSPSKPQLSPTSRKKGTKRKITAHQSIMLEIKRREKLNKSIGPYKSSDSSNEELQPVTNEKPGLSSTKTPSIPRGIKRKSLQL